MGNGGRIVDGPGQPLAGATVRATLQLTVLSLSSPGADHITAYRGPKVKAAGFKDGKVEKIPAGTENVAVRLKRSG